MQKTQPNTSGESIQDLRQRVLQGLPCRAAVLVDLIDALSVGPRPATPSEVGLSPLWGYANSTLYSGLREGATPATVAALREARLTWWEQWGDELREGAAGWGPRPRPSRPRPKGFMSYALALSTVSGL